MKEVISQHSIMGLFNRKKKKKATKAELSKVAQRHREFKVMMYGGLCGLILALTPILAIGLTPGNITRDYISGQILFSNSSGGTSTSALNQLITNRLNSFTTMPLNVVNGQIIGNHHNGIVNRLGSLGTYTVMGFLHQQQRLLNGMSIGDIHQRVISIENKLNALLPPQPQAFYAIQPLPQFGGGYISNNGNSAFSMLRFQFNINDSNFPVRMDRLALQVITTGGATADQLILDAILKINRIPITGLVTSVTSNNEIIFDNINRDFLNIFQDDFEIDIIVRDISASDPIAGEGFCLSLPENTFDSSAGGQSSITDLTLNTPAINNTPEVSNCNKPFVVQQDIPVFVAGFFPSSTDLVAGDIEVFGFSYGTPTLRPGRVINAGSGLPDSNFQFKITKSADVQLGGCFLRRVTVNTPLTNTNNQFTVDPFSNVSSAPGDTVMYLSFDEQSFLAGEVYSSADAFSPRLVCDITSVGNPGDSIGVDITTDLDIRVYDNGVSLLNDPSLMPGLPIMGPIFTTP